MEFGIGSITQSCRKSRITGTEAVKNPAICPVRDVAAGILNTATVDRHARQRMTYNTLQPLFSPKTVIKVAQWNVRTMYEIGKCAQIAKEMRNYEISVLGISEARWNQSGVVTLATGETILTLVIQMKMTITPKESPS